MKKVLLLLSCLCIIGCFDQPSKHESGAKIEVLSKTFKITEQNEYYWVFSWQTVLTNTGDKDAEVFYKVNFRDQDNYVLDYSYKSAILGVGQELNCSGLCHIEHDLAVQVRRMTVNIGNIYD